MFEAAELGRAIDKHQYNAIVPRLRTDLLLAQNQLYRDRRFSVVVVIGGVDGAGKGDTVNTLHEWMDPRYLQAQTFGAPSEEEQERPHMWRFWRELPPKGRIGIFFGSWYTQPILRRVYGRSDDAELDVALQHINHFEKMLANDGTLVLKYWFHLSKQAQRRRLRKLSKDPKLAWRVTKTDWKHFELYDDFVVTSKRALRETSTGEAPWQIVEGQDWRYRDVTVGQHLLANLRAHLDAPLVEHVREPAAPVLRGGQPTVLDRVDLSKNVEKKTYEDALVEWQGRLNRLSRRAVKAKTTTVVVFEGPDAAGKGGAIRRITRALDARYYRIVPIAAPTDEERARHYLWRFWRQLPRAGYLAIFDRSWYGRILVERVEGFARPPEWGRAYKEINEFEENLAEFGIGLAKFWLHIDPEEQARRFAEREQTSYKEFKITEEDYRNREKWSLYEDAVHEMVARTSTDFAPWTLVAANDKRHARLEVLKTLCGVLERCVRQAEKRKKR